MSSAISRQISLFRIQLENRRFNGAALQILDSILAAKDIRSLLEIRSALGDLLRSEIAPVLGEIAKKSAYEKLLTVDFFVKAFALVGDTESCLALKYEALVLRETKCAVDHDLHVSYQEWYAFGKDSLDNGFYTIAVKGFERALLCIQSHGNIDPDLDTFSIEAHMIDEIKKLRDMAATLVASHSESANYMKRKAIHDEGKWTSRSDKRQEVASVTFRNGIKRRNMMKLQQSQRLLQNTTP
ncbi:uncharacterized protein LOC109822780 isoform X2 [Asparagus officinalis]|uniref:uncharacterized protein LOC109822780 isoform X2 n=1 Tax=Asparagus officinalis TaxID=4686 RepID=UPI00098E8452|nr:uncharacterized protein LOC109822780 isoform X2 [Asparagus officinalis]